MYSKGLPALLDELLSQHLDFHALGNQESPDTKVQMTLQR